MSAPPSANGRLYSLRQRKAMDYEEDSDEGLSDEDTNRHVRAGKAARHLQGSGKGHGRLRGHDESARHAASIRRPADNASLAATSGGRAGASVVTRRTRSTSGVFEAAAAAAAAAVVAGSDREGGSDSSGDDDDDGERDGRGDDEDDREGEESDEEREVGDALSYSQAHNMGASYGSRESSCNAVI